MAFPRLETLQGPAGSRGLRVVVGGDIWSHQRQRNAGKSFPLNPSSSAIFPPEEAEEISGVLRLPYTPTTLRDRVKMLAPIQRV